MLDKNEMVKVTNRDNGSIGYSIPDLNNLRRVFASGETKEITVEELRKLSFIPGGMNLLRKYLVIDNEQAIEEILGEVEPEYHYTDEDIKTLLEKGSLDQFEDCLNFAPAGVIDLIRKYAIELELNDVKKREMFLEKTGFNITSAIEANKANKEEIEETPKATGRKATPIKAATKPTRNVTIIKK